MDKQGLNLREPEITLPRVDGFEARWRAEKNTVASGGDPADLQITDQFLSRYIVVGLMKVKSFVTPTEAETVLERYRDRLEEISAAP